MFLGAAVVFLLPFFAFLVELAFVAAAVVVTIAFRIIFRRPWVVEAATPSDMRRRPFLWRVPGFLRSGRLVT
ncbi:MAG TPA: hypothetical protein VEA19_03955, partial [Actinomycetota bacterium]|nr:hypothetical protein [Actinomycetota bacterium]